MRLFLAAAMWHSALLGAVLLVVADYAAMRVLLAPFQIPVGLATGAVGGVYMLWLLRKVRWFTHPLRLCVGEMMG